MTAEHFLREHRLSIGKAIGGAAERHESEGGEKLGRKAITATLPPLVSQASTQETSLAEKGVDTLDARRRLEIERGAGGDHDEPYAFALPLSWPQRLAWIRLMVKVQHGELEP